MSGRTRGDATGRGGGEAGRGDDEEMTLAFTLSAFEALAYPRETFADARRWSEYVGVVDDDAGAVESAVRRRGVRQDFEIGDLDAQSVLSRLKWEADTDRYVLVGTDERHRELADYVRYEYLPIEEAAAKAGWTLAGELGLVERVRVRVSRLLFSVSGRSGR